MCEILYLSGNIVRHRAAIEGAVAEMCRTNDDGAGWILDRKTTGKVLKFEPGALDRMFAAAGAGRHEVIIHARLATSGGTSKPNTHPVSAGAWAFIHNGIFTGRGTKDKSDTFEFAEDVARDGLKATLEKSRGSWSLFALDTATGRLFYTRHGARFRWGYLPGSRLTIGATDLEGILDFFVEYQEPQKGYYRAAPLRLAEWIIEDNTLYSIDKNGIGINEEVYTPAPVLPDVPSYGRAHKWDIRSGWDYVPPRDKDEEKYMFGRGGEYADSFGD